MILRETMKDLEKRLDRVRFQRCTAAIVNLDLVSRSAAPKANASSADSGAQVKGTKLLDVVARFVH